MKSPSLLLINILLTGLMYIGGFVILGDGFPTVNSTGQEILGWFINNGEQARGYAWTGAFFSLGFVIFGGQISSLLPKQSRYIFLAGAVGCAITAQVQGWIWAGIAFSPSELSAGGVKVLFSIASFWGPFVNASTAAMAISIASIGLAQSSIIPKWLTWLSLAFFVEQAIETVTIFGKTGFIAPGGAMNVYLGGVIGFLWIAGVVHWARKTMATNLTTSAISK